MPRATKDSEKEELNKKKTSVKKASTSTKKATSTKATTAKKKKVDEEKATKTTAKKVSTTKNKNTSKAASEDKKVASKKTASTKSTSTAKKSDSPKATTAKKKTSAKATKKKSTTSNKKTTSSATSKKTTTKKIQSSVIAEYYDLPYRYNETVVKILYQTPTILFVYWDISDYDRENYIKQYGENFFNNTKPVLKIYNLTKDYAFEVEINDYANSWYINVNDANCEYRVELIRRTIKYEENLNIDYIHITSSNNIEFPNDHILLEELPDKIKFKNVKTNQVSIKDISTLHLIGINKIYNVYDFYNTFYKNELYEERIINPSSSSWR